MKARSIRGNSVGEIQLAIRETIAGGCMPTLAIVFLTEINDIDPVSAMMNEEGIALFGASTSDKFTEQGPGTESIVVLLLDMNPGHFRIVLKDFASSSVYETARETGVNGKENFNHPAFIITMADFRNPGEEVIRGLLDGAGDHVAVIGGVAGDPVNFHGAVFTNHSKSSNGFLSLILDEDKIDVKGMAVSGWKAIGTDKRITKSEGAWIYTIDGEPAMNVIKKFLGKEITAGERSETVVNLSAYDNYPLQIQRGTGQPMMRPILLWNTTDQSVMVGGPVIEGSLFRFSLPPDLEVVDSVIESSRTIQETHLPDADAMVIFSCVGRMSSLGPMSASELEGLAATWNKPMAGFFSLGEFGKLDDGRPELHGTTVSWVALKEK